MSQRFQPFFQIRKELNPFSFNTTQRIQPFSLNMTQRLEPFFLFAAKNWNFFLFASNNWAFFFKNFIDSKNWTSLPYELLFSWLELNSFFFLINTTQRVEFFTKNDSKCWTPFWIWLKELNLFCIGLKELNFFSTIWLKELSQSNIEKFFFENNPIPKNDSKNWTLFCLFQQWLKELNSL